MGEIISTLIEFFSTLFVTPFNGLIRTLTETVTAAAEGLSIPGNMRDFVGAFISNFIPVRYFITTMGVILPVYAMNFVIKLFLRLRALLPM